MYTDSETGITFDTWIVPDKAASSTSGTWGGMTMGFALPEDALETDADEFIGYLVGLPFSFFSRNYLPLTELIAMSLEQHDIDGMVWYLASWAYDKQLAHHGIPIQRRGFDFLPVCYWLRSPRCLFGRCYVDPNFLLDK